jgi:hypothetical protein
MGVRLEPPTLALALAPAPSPTARGDAGAVIVRQVTFDGFVPGATAFDVFDDVLRQNGFLAGVSGVDERQLLRLLDCLVKRRLPAAPAAAPAPAGRAEEPRATATSASGSASAFAPAALVMAAVAASAAPAPSDADDSYGDSFAEQTEDRSDLADAFF